MAWRKPTTRTATAIPNQSQATLRRVGVRCSIVLVYRECGYSALSTVSKSRMQTVVKMMS